MTASPGPPWLCPRRLCPLFTALVVVAGCASQPARPVRAGSDRTSPGREAQAARYLAIALPANRRLDAEENDYTRYEHHDLAQAESALRAQAATERAFDQALLKIAFPHRVASAARALVQANQRRIALTERQARSNSISGLVSFDGLHKVADAGVEARVRIIRSELGLPPPDNS